MSRDWDNFISDLDPFLVEQERFRLPSPNERPGSSADNAMRFAHEVRVARLKDIAAGPERLAAAAAEGAHFDRTSGYEPSWSPLSGSARLRIARAVVARDENVQQGRKQKTA